MAQYDAPDVVGTSKAPGSLPAAKSAVTRSTLSLKFRKKER